MNQAKAKVGHGITVQILELAADRGLFTPKGNYVLVRAIWAEHANAAMARLTLDADGVSMQSIMEAVAFEVHAIGPEVPPGEVSVGEVVLNTSISGETINGNKQAKGSPWMLVRYEDLCGGIKGKDLEALLSEIRTEAQSIVDGVA